MKLFGRAAFLTVLAFSLQAAIIYDNTVGAPVDTDPVLGLGPLYDSFTSPYGAQITGLALIPSGNGNFGGSLNVGLYADQSTTPGPLIANLGTLSDSLLSTSLATYDIALTTNLLLAAGTRYWIGLSGITSTNWSFSDDLTGPGVSGEFFSNQLGTFSNEDGPYQMRLTADLASAIPEPGSFILVFAAAGLLGIGQSRSADRLRAGRQSRRAPERFRLG